MSKRLEELRAELAQVIAEGRGLDAYAGAKVAVLDCEEEAPPVAPIVRWGGVQLL